MFLKETDIDQILEETVELDTNLAHVPLYHYEIDLLLEQTKDW